MVNEKDLGPAVVAQANAVGLGNVLHWTMPYGEGIDGTIRGMRMGVVGREFVLGFYSGVMSLALQLSSGLPLCIVEQRCRELCTKMKGYKLHTNSLLAEVGWQYSLNLMGQSDNTTALSGIAMDEANRDPWVRQNKVQEMCLVGMKLQLCRIFGADDKVIKQLTLAFEKDEKAIQISPLLYDIKFNLALLWYQLARQSKTKKLSSRYLSKARAIKKYMKKMTKVGCPHYNDTIALLEAEEAWCQQKAHDDAGEVHRLYDVAVAAACGKVHHEAFACEQAALYLESQGDVTSSASYMVKAIAKYREWNAYAKADALEAETQGKHVNVGGVMTGLCLHVPSSPEGNDLHDFSEGM